MSYYTDSRTRAKALARSGTGLDVDEETMMATVFVSSEEIGHLHCTYEVCPTCNGKGQHVSASIDAGGIPARRFAEDPGFAEHYFGGTYDVPCNECGGKRVVPEPAPRGSEEEAVFKRYKEALREEAEYQAAVAAERHMGA